MKMFLNSTAVALFGHAAGMNCRIRNMKGTIGFKPSTRPSAVRKGDSVDVAFAQVDMAHAVGSITTLREDESHFLSPTGCYALAKGKLGWQDSYQGTDENPIGENTPHILVADDAQAALTLLEALDLPESIKHQLGMTVRDEAQRETEAAEAARAKAAETPAVTNEASGETPAPAPTKRTRNKKK